MLLINGGSDCSVSWQVGSSATLGTGTSLLGSILALDQHHPEYRRQRVGKVLARNGAVTLDDNHVAVCGGGISGPAEVIPTLSQGR